MQTTFNAGLTHFPEPDIECGGQRSGLGMSLDSLFGAGVGFVVGGPAGATAGGTYATSLMGLVHGGSANPQRIARVAWTLKAAQSGSPLAASIIEAAPNYVAGDEAPFWRAALSQVPQRVLDQANANAPGGWWPDGQPDFFTDENGPTHRHIVEEMQAAQAGQSVGQTTTAAINAARRASASVSPVMLAGAGLAVVALMMTLGKRRRA